MIYLDTYVVVWLYQGDIKRLSPKAISAIENEDLYISPIVQLELQYLHQIDRITMGSKHIITDLQAQIGLRICDLPFAEIIEQSIRESGTRDPFDRVIVSHCRTNETRLTTKDSTIQENFRRCVW